MEKIIRTVSMHRHHKYNQNNNQYRNQVTRQPTTSYNHVINDLQDYMLYGKLLVHSLKTRSKMNAKHKIMTTNEDSIELEKEKEKLMKKEKERFFYPSQKDQLYWCFFIMKNGFTAYEYPDVSSFVNEKTEKINVIISFLAVLELVKRGLLSVNQNSKYNDITLESNEVGTPTFEI